MFDNLFGGWHIIIFLVIIVLLFGATKLPALAKAVGQSARIFKTEVRSVADDPTPPPNVVADVPSVAATVTPVVTPAAPVTGSERNA